MSKKTAEDFAKQQKEISISEFFEKNKHLLGFDNPTKALLMAVKEAVDNSLDACEEAEILPDITVKIKNLKEDVYKVSVQDNGPGIVKEQVPRIFGKLLYGSKFHRLRQSRGQQGIGICTTPDTLIPLADGRIKRIEDIVESELEEEIFTLAPDMKLVPNKMKKFWKLPAPEKMIKIKMLGGGSLTLTRENPVLIKTDFGLNWKPAELVAPRDYIAMARNLSINHNEKKIPLISLLDENVRVDNYEFLSEVLSILKKRHGTWSKLGNIYGLQKDLLKGWKKMGIRRRPTLKQYIMLAKDAGFSEDYITESIIRVGRLGTYIKIFRYMTPELARLAGLVAGDGNIQAKRKNRWGTNISFWNNDTKLIEEFCSIVYNFFGIRPNVYAHTKGRGTGAQFSSSIVADILEKLGVPRGRKSEKFEIPDLIRQNGDLSAAYLGGLFDAEGSVSSDRKCITLMLSNKNVINVIRLMLLRFGIVSRINKAGKHTRLIISSAKNVEKFKNIIGFTIKTNKAKLDSLKFYNDRKCNLEVIPHVKYAVKNSVKEIGTSYYALRSPNEISSIRRGSAVSHETLNSLCEVLVENSGERLPLPVQELVGMANADVTWAKVIETKEIDSPCEYVYDITMGIGNNFVANGFVIHNSAVVLYSQLTTGSPTRVLSKTDEKKKTQAFELIIDTKKNEPEIVKHEEKEDGIQGTGIRVEMDVVGRYRKSQGVDDYLKQTSISNPFAKISYNAPDGTKMLFSRTVNELPVPPKEIKIHPYGVEFGILQRFLNQTNSRTLQAFLVNEFSSVGQQTAKEMCNIAKLDPNMKPIDLSREHIEKLLGAMQKAKVQRPPLDCLSPIGEKELEKSLKKEYPDAEFITTLTRSPEVYRGNPFQIEVGIVYGGPDIKSDGPIEVIRLANRVPLLYQAGACATMEAIKEVDWKRYGLQQSGNNLPIGPVILVVHMCSAWVPFISESKEAIASYPDIIKEMKLAVQDAGRNLSRYLSGKRRAGDAKRRIQIFERYSAEVASAVSLLTKKSEKDIEKKLKNMIAQRTHIKDEEEKQEI